MCCLIIYFFLKFHGFVLLDHVAAEGNIGWHCLSSFPVIGKVLYLYILIPVLQNPAIADVYTEHPHTVGVAKYAPSGYYIASGGKRPGHEHVISHQVTTSSFTWHMFSFFFLYLINLLDASGKVRIWDTTQKEHILKYEYTPISGIIKDIAWTEDSKRMAVVGGGREKWVWWSFRYNSTLNLQ